MNPDDEVQMFTPEVIHAGPCDHYLVFHHQDADGMVNARCSKCHHGKLYNPHEEELTDGKLVPRITYSIDIGNNQS